MSQPVSGDALVADPNDTAPEADPAETAPEATDANENTEADTEAVEAEAKAEDESDEPKGKTPEQLIEDLKKKNRQKAALLARATTAEGSLATATSRVTELEAALAEATGQATQATSQLRETLVTNQINDYARDNDLDPKLTLRILDRSALEISDDGKVSNLSVVMESHVEEFPTMRLNSGSRTSPAGGNASRFERTTTAAFSGMSPSELSQPDNWAEFVKSIPGR